MSDFLKKYHAYFVALAAVVTVLVQAVFGIPIPNWVYELLGALGIGAVRVTVSQVGGTGWKTYALAGALAIVAGLRAYGIPIPMEIDATIAALAAGTLSSSVKKI